MSHSPRRTTATRLSCQTVANLRKLCRKWIVQWALAEPAATVALVPHRQLDERAMALLTE